MIPAGAFDGTKGWKANGSGSRYRFVDRSKPSPLIRKLAISAAGQGSDSGVKLVASGRGEIAVAAGDEPLQATISLGAAAGACVEARFASTACVFNDDGDALTCRE